MFQTLSMFQTSSMYKFWLFCYTPPDPVCKDLLDFGLMGLQD